jgi:hypothetical protein
VHKKNGRKNRNPKIGVGSNRVLLELRIELNQSLKGRSEAAGEDKESSTRKERTVRVSLY